MRRSDPRRFAGARRARENGLGAAFAQGAGEVAFVFALFTAAAVSFYLLGLKGLILVATVCVLTFVGRMFFQRKLGGLTGDTIGCISELNEFLVLVVISAV